MRRVAAFLVVLAVAGCGAAERRPAAVRVVATTTQVGDLVRSVAGSRAQVTQILRPTSDPHDFEPRPSDARALGRAGLLFASGGELDDWVEGLAGAAGSKAERVTLLDEIAPTSKDPHWWQDPREAVRAVAVIRDRLSRADPRGRAAYARNTRSYIRRLRALDRSIAACMARVPAARRKLVTTHDAFGYFARRYHVRVIGALIPSLSTQAQPSGREVGRLVAQVRSEGVKAIFPETALDPRLERAVSREAGVRVGGVLWADSLGPPGSGAETYLKAMAANARALAEGMSGGTVTCRAPVGGV